MKFLIFIITAVVIVGILNVLLRLDKSRSSSSLISIDNSFTDDDVIYHKNDDFWDDAMINPANPLYHLFHPDYSDSGHDDWDD